MPHIFRFLLTAVIAVAVIVGIGWGLISLVMGNLVGMAKPVDLFQSSVLTSEEERKQIQIIAESKDDPVLGNTESNIKIVAFFDYGCPFCKQEIPVIEELLSRHEDISFIIRDFPVESLHPNATQAAKAVNCAYRQGKYLEMVKSVMEHSEDFSDAALEKDAKSVGLNRETFQTCLQADLTTQEIIGDQQDALAVGVMQTPVFFVNGYRVAGAVPIDVFEQIIDIFKQHGR